MNEVDPQHYTDNNPINSFFSKNDSKAHFIQKCNTKKKKIVLENWKKVLSISMSYIHTHYDVVLHIARHWIELNWKACLGCRKHPRSINLKNRNWKFNDDSCPVRQMTSDHNNNNNFYYSSQQWPIQKRMV